MQSLAGVTHMEKGDDVPDSRVERQASESKGWKGTQKILQRLFCISVYSFAVLERPHMDRGVIFAPNGY